MNTPTFLPPNNNYFMANVTFLFKLVRVMKRIGINVAACDTRLSEKTIQQFEANNQKAGCCDTYGRLGDYLGFIHVPFHFDSPPPQDCRDELNAKGKKLGYEMRNINTPRPSTRAARELDAKQMAWGENMLRKVYGKNYEDRIKIKK